MFLKCLQGKDPQGYVRKDSAGQENVYATEVSSLLDAFLWCSCMLQLHHSTTSDVEFCPKGKSGGTHA